MKDYLILARNVVLWLIGNAIVFHFVLPLWYFLLVQAETPEEIPVDEQAN